MARYWTGSSRTKPPGRDTSRPEPIELLRYARDGDTVVVHSMDRLARNLDGLRVLVQTVTRKGIRVEAHILNVHRIEHRSDVYKPR
jgi:DNA invertase Pin-like site-specific DNA recombinase